MWWLLSENSVKADMESDEDHNIWPADWPLPSHGKLLMVKAP
jgi:hypothetical protein